MSFFSNLFSPSAQNTVTFETEQEAFLAILLAVASADGIYTDQDYQQVASLIGSNLFFANTNLPEMRRKLLEKANRVGNLERLIPSAVQVLDPHRKRSVFVYCMDIILADGMVTADEEHIMEEIRNGLGISDAFAQATFEVVIAKNQG